MALPTKYVRQRTQARATITRKGTVCTWQKVAPAPDDPDVPPEFAAGDTPVPYPNTPIVLYAADRQSLATQIAVAITGEVSNQTYALIPGDVPFTPEVNDDVLFADGTVRTVNTVNTTQPDGVPIIHEVTFK